MRRGWRWVLLLTVVAAAGCSDPYSQRRIGLRQGHTRELVEGIEKVEQHRRQRLSEMGPTVREWWEDDCELFRKRSPTVGDYIW